MFDEPTAHEAAQHALDYGAERAVGLGEPLQMHTEKLLNVLLHLPEERRLARPPRLVDPAGDLHAQPGPGWAQSGGSAQRRC